MSRHRDDGGRTRCRPAHTLQRGWAFPITLFAIALILSSLRVLSLQSTSVSQLLQTIRAGARSYEETKRSLEPLITNQRGCVDTSPSSDSRGSALSVCGEGLVPFTSAPPLPLPAQRIDYDALFTTALPCPGVRKAMSGPLSLVPNAEYDCILPSSLSSGMAVIENIVADSVALVPRSGSTMLLASPGGIAIHSTLSIDRDLLVVAGGSIAIARISSIRSDPVRVTVISSLGDVTVGSVGGNVSLLIIGRAKLSAPPTETSPPYPLPPMRSASLFGFAPK